MFYFPADCPTCKKPQTFVVTSVGEYRVLEEKRIVQGQPRIPGRTLEQHDLVKTYGSGTCPNCRQPVLFVFKITSKQLEKAKEAIQKNRQYTVKNAELIESYPPQPEYYSNKAYPDDLKKPFVDLQIAMDQGHTPAFILAGCRMVLEAAVKNLGAKGNGLFPQIDDLVEKGILSNLLGDWAHLIREYGNRAAHQLDGAAEEAREMIDFTRIFLDYAYVLPYRINKHRRNSP